jgi:hypothetical protein
MIQALDDIVIRAKATLSAAAALAVDGNTVRITNLTGHKLISGYPEGRRMWLNIKWYDGIGTQLREDGAYGDVATVEIEGTPTTVRSLLDLEGTNTKVYEAHAAITQEWADKLVNTLGMPGTLPLAYDRVTGAVVATLADLVAQAPGTYMESFHFVLNNKVVKDNRIPPWRMRYDESVIRSILPVPATQYGNPGPGGEYDHWDEVVLNPPSGAVTATIDLLYQPTSWEYVQFLYLGNDGTNAFLGEQGEYLLEAWANTGMAEPHAMATAVWNSGVSTYTVGGTVSGLAGTGLVLQNNDGDDLAIGVNGSFTFATELADGSPYSVTVLTQPTGLNQECSVTNASGTLSGANVTDVVVTCVTNTYTVGGTVSGLDGTGLVLQNNEGDDLAIGADGGFTFATELADGSPYSVAVLTQPTGLNQECSVTSGTGTLAGANVTDVVVTCVTNTYTIGGTVSGLDGTGLVLQNNDGDDLVIGADGDFTFATELADGSPYSVTVLTQPTGLNQECSVTNASGTLAGANVTDVVVTCVTNTYSVGGTVSGLSGTGLVLQNNDGDDLVIGADGDFTFATELADGSPYSVTVLTQPTGPNQTCSVTNGSGTLAGANVTDVVVTCVTNTYSIGGTVSGLAGTGLVLQNNDGDDVVIGADGDFTFATELADGSPYSVTVLIQPTDPSQVCDVSNGSGQLAGSDVSDVNVTCATKPDDIFIDSFEG